MKKKLIILISVVLTGVTLFAIWQFSAQSSGETSALSSRLARKVLYWMQRLFASWGEELEPLRVEAVLRKLAHFGVFMALGLGLTGIFVWQKRVPVAIIVILIGMVYAMIDEYHQSFVPGRNPSWIDVMIDVAGVGVGMIVALIIVKLIHWGSKDVREEN